MVTDGYRWLRMVTDGYGRLQTIIVVLQFLVRASCPTINYPGVSVLDLPSKHTGSGQPSSMWGRSLSTPHTPYNKW